MKKRLLVIHVIGVISVCLLFIVSSVGCANKTENKEIPLYYSSIMIDELKNEDTYRDSDLETKMGLMLEKLTDVSQNGTEEYPEFRIQSDSIAVDYDEATISFCDQDGTWWRYEFNYEFLVMCSEDRELHFLVSMDEFIDSDVDTQMDMFYDKLISMSDGVAERMNEPFIDPSSIVRNDKTQVICYRCIGEGYTRQYSFITHTFTLR